MLYGHGYSRPPCLISLLSSCPVSIVPLPFVGTSAPTVGGTQVSDIEADPGQTVVRAGNLRGVDRSSLPAPHPACLSLHCDSSLPPGKSPIPG